MSYGCIRGVHEWRQRDGDFPQPPWRALPRAGHVERSVLQCEGLLLPRLESAQRHRAILDSWCSTTATLGRACRPPPPCPCSCLPWCRRCTPCIPTTTFTRGARICVVLPI